MKGGLYRNGLGVELRVTRFMAKVGEFTSLGDTYLAEYPDHKLTDERYVVTETSLRDCGYELIEEDSL